MKRKSEIFVETNYQKVNFHGDRICGDSFVQRYFPNQDRTVAVLSDGMGHGIKANILSTLTSSILVNMIEAKVDLRIIAGMIIKTLPVCSIRGISYSTFTIIDFHHRTNVVDIVEYDNPQCLILRSGEPLAVEWESHEFDSDNTLRRTLQTTSFQTRQGDGIVVCSDGVSQSGLGSRRYPFGWGVSNFQRFVCETVRENPRITSRELSSRVVERAITLDSDRPKDDISCVAIHLRRPEKLLFCSCPPTIEAKSHELASYLVRFEGRRAISGYPLAELVAREMHAPIRKNITSTDPDVPPIWHIAGIDLVTEGLITLGKVLDILEKHRSDAGSRGRGGAFRLCDMLLQADVIEMIIGLRERVDTATVWSDDYVLRRKVLHAIADILENKFSKQVEITYL